MILPLFLGSVNRFFNLLHLLISFNKTIQSARLHFACVGSVSLYERMEPLRGWGASYRLLFMRPLRDFVAVALPHRQGALSRTA